MKRIIRANEGAPLELVTVIADIMKDPAGRKLYAKLQLVDPQVLDGYVEGVADTLNATGQSVRGFDRLYDMILEHGREAVWEVMKATQGTKE